MREFDCSQLPTWDAFVVSSPQGNIFSESVWLTLMGYPFTVYGCFKGHDLVGGTAVLESSAHLRTMESPPLTPFQGFLLRDNSRMKATEAHSLEMRTAAALVEMLEARYDHLTLCHHYTFQDLRCFYFRAFGRPAQYQTMVRCTYVVDLRDVKRTWAALDDKTRYEIRKAMKNGSVVEESSDFDVFDRMHLRTFQRQGVNRDIPAELLRRMYEQLKSCGRCQLYLAKNAQGATTSGAVAIWDNKRAYYILGASEPEHRNDGSASLTLWTMFERMAERGSPEIDLVGCNSPKRGAFKAGFGGALKPYFVVSLDRS